MLRFLADENFHGAIVGGLRRQLPNLDILRVQDVGLATTPDPLVLEWAGVEGRVLLTQDVETVPGYAYLRAGAGLSMPGVFIVPNGTAIGAAIADLAILAAASRDGEYEGQVVFLPL